MGIYLSKQTMHQLLLARMEQSSPITPHPQTTLKIPQIAIQLQIQPQVTVPNHQIALNRITLKAIIVLATTTHLQKTILQLIPQILLLILLGTLTII